MMKLDELHKKFFKERNNEVKKNIKRQIEDTEWILIQETLSHSGNSDKIKELEKLRKQKRKPYFLWKLEFARVFKEKGGFDIIVGNPPYIGFHKVPHKEESKKIFYSANGKYDFYVLFIEKAINLLKNKGNLTYICPSYFYKRNYGQKLREFLLRETNIKLIIDFQDSQIFETAQTYTCIFSTEKEKSNGNNLIKIKENLDFNGKELLLEQENLIEPQWIIQKDSQNGIVERCKKKSKISLADISISISQGIVTGNNSVYLISEKTIKEYGMNYNYLKKAYKGKDIKNGKLIESGYYIFYPYNFDKNNKNVLVDENEIEEMNPQLLKYLVEHKEELLTREYFLKSNKKWYELWNPRKAIHFYNRKFVFSEINNKNDFVLTNECFYTDSACGFELKKEYQKFEDIIEKYLNSNIATDLLKQISVPKANGYFIYKNSFLKDFPIVIDLENEEEITSFKQLKSGEEIDNFIYEKIIK
ncbi:Eco57I restriction-modification methylase domain-containing protein [Cetobacterium sp.]|uniref:Eco57I restriction-modification methylase domain-containing protein n=1 Tax=Cetobacterium sp. TaxID=2071632 RepID=UPI003F678CE1